MSIILRKEGQQLLDNVGLDNYHFSMSSSKQMSIVSECGNILCFIKGVYFTRVNPSKNEINYALELADSFLVKYVPLLKEKLELRKQLKDFDTTDINSDYKSGEFSSKSYKLKDYTLFLNCKGFILRVSSIKDKVSKITIPEGLVKEHLKTVKEFNERRKVLDKLEELNEQLESCSI